jgi:hypothetical protein
MRSGDAESDCTKLAHKQTLQKMMLLALTLLCGFASLSQAEVTCDECIDAVGKLLFLFPSCWSASVTLFQLFVSCCYSFSN